MPHAPKAPMTREMEGALRADLARLGSGERAGGLVAASAPGRVELAGNHTDLQGGRTISASIAPRVWGLAAADPGSEEAIVWSEGFGEVRMGVHDLGPRPEERTSTAALVRGMLAGYARHGAGRLRGFRMAVRSDLPAGRGVSSSAAFEMMLGRALQRLFDPPGAPAPDPVDLALWGSHVEQAYFDKLAGAQDQLASACGGVLELDFSAARPAVAPIALDAARLGCTPVLVDSRSDHARFTDEFSSVSRDMAAVAALWGAERLVEVPFPTFLERFSRVREELGDRPALRALHFYEETRRVGRQARALREGDAAAFLALVRQSGASSAQVLQNVTPTSDTTGSHQPATVVLGICAHVLDGEGLGLHEGVPLGACRIHGGGFGGCALAFVPDENLQAFTERMDALLGYDACTPVELAPQSACATWLGEPSP